MLCSKELSHKGLGSKFIKASMIKTSVITYLRQICSFCCWIVGREFWWKQKPRETKWDSCSDTELALAARTKPGVMYLALCVVFKCDTSEVTLC